MHPNEYADRLRGAMSVNGFCQTYKVSRTTFYEEVKAGRLRAIKCGHKTLVTEEDASTWLRSLPAMQAAPSAA